MHSKTPKPGFQAATLLAGVIMLLIIFVSAGYILTLPAPDQAVTTDPQLQEIDEQRSLWKRRKPDAYEYVVDRDCNCDAEYADPYRVTVNAAGKTFRFDADYGAPGLDNGPAEPADIDLLFDLIEAAIVSDHVVMVFYDSEYGYPSNARIIRDGASLDEEYTFDVRGFQVIR
ncbi:MAG: DUF6174 domain-containing protein [Woeseiaceae bacterium]|nr:DUF6174 domain-containing protein [Woeseiaceae bacterium]